MSKLSAMPIWIWLTCPARTGALSVSTTVIPSNWLSMPPRNGALSRYSAAFDPPPLMV